MQKELNMKVPHSRVMIFNFFLLTLFVGVAHADYRDDEWNHNAVFTTQKQAGTKVSGLTAAVVLGLKLLFGSDNEEVSHKVSSGQGNKESSGQQSCVLGEPNPAEVERARLKNLEHKRQQKIERAKREAQERVLAIEQEKEAAEHRKRASAIDCVAQLYAESEFCVVDPLDDPKLTLFGGLSSDSEWQNEWRERRSKFAQ
ncbi:hypothetical protein HOF51_03085, partial [bacterium]|nr:hypothetical protein [bacterium]MBT6130945.1 hypothetical protein [bacterium]